MWRPARYIRPAALLLLASMLGGCLGGETPETLPGDLARNHIESKSYLVSFHESGTGEAVTRDGHPLVDFLTDLTRDPPGYVSLQPVGDALPSDRLLDILSRSGLMGVSSVGLLAPAAGSDRLLDIEVTYYFYRLADCGIDLSYRKLDHMAMTSPGFGCAVERNRMLSLARPTDWYGGRRLAPPLAQMDAKAVTTLHDRAPIAFPPADR